MLPDKKLVAAVSFTQLQWRMQRQGIALMTHRYRSAAPDQHGCCLQNLYRGQICFLVVWMWAALLLHVHVLIVSRWLQRGGSLAAWWL
jgi:hypothetical protein